MSVVLRNLISLVDQAVLSARWFGGVAEELLTEVVEELQEALGALLARFLAREDRAADVWLRTRKAEANRLVRMEEAVEREVVYIHDEVVRRLRRARYKAGWILKLKFRLIPEVWLALRSEFQAAGAEVELEGDKEVVSFVDVDVVSRIFCEDRLVSGGSKFAELHGVFVKYFCKPPKEFPYSAVVFDVAHPCKLSYASSKCELTVECHWQHIGVNGLLKA